MVQLIRCIKCGVSKYPDEIKDGKCKDCRKAKAKNI